MRGRGLERGLALLLAAATALLVAACGGDDLAPSARPSVAGATPPATPAVTEQPTQLVPSTAPMFADAWLAVVEAFDTRATDLLISNPLSEWDLVGVRLIDLIDQARGQLSGLAPPAALGKDVQALVDAIAATQAMLEAIEPHGDRSVQASAFREALDDWVEHVLPRAEAIRDALGLPPVPAGDLQL